MKTTIEKIGQITLKHNSNNSNPQKTGAIKLRAIVKWMDNRSELLNINKSHLELIREFNNS